MGAGRGGNATGRAKLSLTEGQQLRPRRLQVDLRRSVSSKVGDGMRLDFRGLHSNEVPVTRYIRVVYEAPNDLVGTERWPPNSLPNAC